MNCLTCTPDPNTCTSTYPRFYILKGVPTPCKPFTLQCNENTSLVCE